ncbi:MAG: topoisomerase DNA-binding C4 zinc finger domain-containing protein [Parcubacteria group bacterium]
MAADPELVKGVNTLIWTVAKYIIPVVIVLGVIEIGIEFLKRKLKHRNKTSGRCPRCGGTLVQKNGKFGPFIGCSNFPRCNYTRQVS